MNRAKATIRFATTLAVLSLAQIAAAQLPASEEAVTPAIVEQGEPQSLPAATGRGVEEQLLSKDGSHDGRAGGSGGLQEVLRVVAALCVVAGIVFGLRWLTRRGMLAQTRLPGVVEVLSRTPLAPRHQLVLVRMGSRLVLVGMGPGGLASLGELGDANEVSAIVQQLSPKRPAGGEK